VLLLDEPFSALDNSIRLEMRGFIKDVQKELAWKNWTET
jgi:ABC-type thiamine transport system ATPase subunit